MAVYDGFFDAVADEETGEFDRAYGSEDFTGYFAHIIGSGVCIHNNQDSFKVRFENGAAVVSPGYLFIEGYWLKNDEDYTISATGDATLAIVAHLNLGGRMIELEARSVAQAYPDSLVLALVNPAAGTAEDTRHNTDICGTIDTAGELTKKVEWALNYIDNEIEDKLAAAEADILEQSKRLDSKIAEVQAQVDKIAPPPIGSIKFSASEDVGPGWLPCNGDFISESQYPELVAALGKLTPSGDKFKLISDGEIGTQISNGVLYNGRMWVYSYSTKKLYGVDVEGTEPIKEIAVTSNSEYFSNFLAPSTKLPICLSIVPHKSGTGAKIFISQSTGGGISGEDYGWLSGLLLFQAEFTGDENSIEFSVPFLKIPVDNNQYPIAAIFQFLPYVVSFLSNGEEKYLCAVGSEHKVNGRYFVYIIFGNNEVSKQDTYGGLKVPTEQNLNCQRTAFSKKSKDELIFVTFFPNSSGSPTNSYRIESYTKYDFYFSSSSIYDFANFHLSATSLNAVSIAGNSKIIAGFTIDKFPVFSINKTEASIISHNIKLPSSARIFVDAGAYLWAKDIYMIFVGTGIIFSRTLEKGSFGYLDTTSVLGTITQFGYLDYSEDEGTLYIVGQDTTNRVKVAKIVLNTLYDYANDGAWLPMISADGVPAWIKAIGENDDQNITDPVDMQITVSGVSRYANIIFNGDALYTTGTYTRKVSESGTFTVGLRTVKADNVAGNIALKLNGTVILNMSFNGTAGLEKTVTLKTSDYISGGITLDA